MIIDTIPQQGTPGEGVEVFNLAITPSNASNLLIIEAEVFVETTTECDEMIIALFQDSTASAICSNLVYGNYRRGGVRRVLKPGGLNIYTVRHTGDKHYGKGIHRGEGMYEVNGFIVHFFSRDKVTHLAKGYEIVDIEEFEEGALPRKLFMVTLKKTEVLGNV